MPPKPLPKQKITNVERVALAQKLDNDLEAFIKEKQATGPREKTDLDAFLKELDTHPAFCKEIDLTKPLHPLTESLQALKYELDTPDENADNYKDEGNRLFKLKTYKFAIDNYSQGIKLQPTSKLLNAQLYTNRAAAQFRIGNLRSSLMDCIKARTFVPDHYKAIHRGVQCCLDLAKPEQALRWCDEGLHFTATDKNLLEMRTTAEKMKRQQDRNKRKQLAKERKQEIAEKALIRAIKERGVRLADDTGDSTDDALKLTSVETHHPTGAKVLLNMDGQLEWPVLFMYPEHTQTDSIKAFNEHSTFADHIDLMFGEDPPTWDSEGVYRSQHLEIYFENREKETLHKLSLTSTLGEALKHKKYVVTAGTPSFILLSTKSKFTESYLSNYNYKS